jgi:hypothetical protein
MREPSCVDYLVVVWFWEIVEPSKSPHGPTCYCIQNTTPLLRDSQPIDKKVISGFAKIVGKMLETHGYAAGLWETDMIRGVHRRLETFTPVNYSTTLPFWSWAGVGGQSVRHCPNENEYTALSRIENVCVDLVDRDAPFSLVSGGSITISGPFRKLSRLFDRGSELTGAPPSLLECYVVDILGG